MAEVIPINVAVSVLADISLGIYRTPANALKELISNAFDANATHVVISTGYPYFNTMTCRDNGDGMSSKEFRWIMKRIGGSVKRKKGRQYTNMGRPIIGKIGIGILAIAQICKNFTIISSQKGSDTKFEAQIDFIGLTGDEAKEASMGSKAAKRIGNYKLFENLPEEPEAHYTRIILEDIDPGFRDRLLETGGPENKISGYRFKKGDPKALSEFSEWLTKTNARAIPDYFRLLWELSITCPVPYLPNGPIKGHDDVIPDIKENLEKYNFSVKIDGLELRKLILFPTSTEISRKGEDYLVFPIEFDNKVDGSRLAFKGYIYHQRISIHPPELRGLLIRVRNVAIGMYDKSIMNYPKAQGPRMAGISGEIYVEAGLEDALNVDRNSFRETDAHYLKLQEIIYTKLGGDKESKTPGIFSDISKQSKERNKERRRIEELHVNDEIQAILKTLLNQPFIVESSEEEGYLPIEIDHDNGKIIIFEHHPIFPRNRVYRDFLKKILIAYEFANELRETKAEVRKEFYTLLTKSLYG